MSKFAAYRPLAHDEVKHDPANGQFTAGGGSGSSSKKSGKPKKPSALEHAKEAYSKGEWPKIGIESIAGGPFYLKHEDTGEYFSDKGHPTREHAIQYRSKVLDKANKHIDTSKYK